MKIKSLFVSDIHMGCQKNNAKKALEVLKHYEFENLFLVGDIIDIKALAHEWKWTSIENDVWNKIVDCSNKSNVFYIQGNHERCFFDSTTKIERVKIYNSTYIYNENIMICHGDKFDQYLESNIWPRKLIDIAYNSVSEFNLKISSQIKKVVRRTPGYLNQFKLNASNFAKQNNCRTIILGHTHQQEYELIDDINYFNIGDFREDATYMIEKNNGDFELCSL